MTIYDSSNSPTLESLLVLKQKATDIAATKDLIMAILRTNVSKERLCFKYTNYNFKHFS